MVNNVFLIGRLGKDPEVRFTQSGKAVCNFSLATSERYKPQGGETQEITTWHNIVVWGNQAEACGQYLSKGRLACIQGKITNRTWEKDDGTKAYITEIVAHRVTFLGGGKSEGGSRSTGGDSGFQAPPIDDDIPF